MTLPGMPQARRSRDYCVPGLAVRFATVALLCLAILLELLCSVAPVASVFERPSDLFQLAVTIVDATKAQAQTTTKPRVPLCICFERLFKRNNRRSADQ